MTNDEVDKLFQWLDALPEESQERLFGAHTCEWNSEEWGDEIARIIERRRITDLEILDLVEASCVERLRNAVAKTKDPELVDGGAR